VAKNGVTLRNLISNGEDSLEPLLHFRLWLERERNNPKYRWPERRNGQAGPGPMTLSWRRKALRYLLEAQEESGLGLIDAEEVSAIRRKWAEWHSLHHMHRRISYLHACRVLLLNRLSCDSTGCAGICWRGLFGARSYLQNHRHSPC